MDLSKVSDETRRTILDALPGLTKKFRDEELLHAVKARDLLEVVGRLRVLRNYGDQIREGHLPIDTDLSDYRFKDGLMAPLVIAYIERMASV